MAKAKQKSAKKPAKQAKQAKQAAKRAKQPKRVLKALGAKRAKSEPKVAGGSEIERDVKALLASNDQGEIDNVFDIIDELVDYEKRLPKTSPLRKEWDAFFTECEQIMIDVSADRG